MQSDPHHLRAERRGHPAHGPRAARRPDGFSLVGLLVTLTCMLVLFVIGMTALDKAVTGQGSTRDGTVRSVKDQIYLSALHQAMVVHAADRKGRYVTPSALTEDGDRSVDTTANLYSVMVMDNYIASENLVSANERSGYVWEMEDYNYRLYSPRDGVYWDPAFMADLEDLSNTSFAHVPLFGTRFDRHWEAFGSQFPLIGNRGPKDGIDDPASWTYGKDGTWAAHIMFADGHVAFVDTFTPNVVFFERDGARVSDNLYAVEDGPGGADAILSFTERMTDGGAELQFD